MKKKQCYKCKKYKARTEFYKRNSTTNWIASACKECDRKGRKQRKEKQLGRKLAKGAAAYTDKDIATLKDMYERGCSYKEMHKVFPNRSRHALESKLSEMDIASQISYMRKQYSNIERLINIWLLEIGFKFERQVQVGKCYVDFKLDNLVIEVQGSHFHCDIKLYPKGPKYPWQQRNLDRDANKKKFLLDNGLTIIYVWEHDIETRFEEVKQELSVVLNGNIWDNNRPISVELLRDNAEVTKSITKGDSAP